MDGIAERRADVTVDIECLFPSDKESAAKLHELIKEEA
jgi:hypothetical protein